VTVHVPRELPAGVEVLQDHGKVQQRAARNELGVARSRSFDDAVVPAPPPPGLLRDRQPDRRGQGVDLLVAETGRPARCDGRARRPYGGLESL
jgi:hypothetical protein